MILQTLHSDGDTGSRVAVQFLKWNFSRLPFNLIEWRDILQLGQKKKKTQKAFVD